ncbi:ATP-binding protein [soil metagenome]
MRGILIQVTGPPLVAGLLGVLGFAVGQTLAGILLGTLLGGLLAYGIGRRARSKLQTIQSQMRRNGRVMFDDYPYSSSPDEIDDVYHAVAGRLGELEDIHIEELKILTRQSQLLDRMNDGIMRVDANSIVSYANVAASALFRGRNPAGRPFIAVTRDHELNDLVQRNLRTGEDQQHTFEIPGETSVVNAVVTRLAESPSESLVVLRDISEVTRLQTLRREFVANVSHDLRTPLSAIKIMTETLLDLQQHDADSQRFLGKIDDEVNVMTALVNDLLDLANLEGREGGLNLRPVIVQRLIDEIRERMEPIAERHNVALAVNVDPVLAEVVADERRLHQVLVNLVNNAIVHTPSGGRIEIRAIEGGSHVVFEVCDTGTGIHPEDLPRVWERFFRADRSRSGRGTGLGLAIVKHVVLAHGGTVDASSELGRGSEFRFTIPRVPAQISQRSLSPRV